MATIAENLQSLVTAKNDIATAITNKGVILPENAGFLNFASAIDSITSSVQPIELYPTDVSRKYSNPIRMYLQEETSLTYTYYPPYAYIINGTMMFLRIYMYYKKEYRYSESTSIFTFNDLPIMTPNLTYTTIFKCETTINGTGSGGIYEHGYDANGKFYVTARARGDNGISRKFELLISYI